jgi:hypothetical protein
MILQTNVSSKELETFLENQEFQLGDWIETGYKIQADGKEIILVIRRDRTFLITKKEFFCLHPEYSDVIDALEKGFGQKFNKKKYSCEAVKIKTSFEIEGD